jgi:uncharacterized protein (TIGR01244 family)
MTRLISSQAILFLLLACASTQERAPDAVAFVSSGELTEGAAIPPDTRFVSSGQPDAAVLEALAEEGFTLVVDFRREGEDRGIDEKQTVESLGMSYANVPIGVPDGISLDNAAAFNQLIEQHEGRVFLHCGSGERAGAMFALRENLLGASDEDAMAAGKAAGLNRLEDTVRERLAEQE